MVEQWKEGYMEELGMENGERESERGKRLRLNGGERNEVWRDGGWRTEEAAREM